MNIRIAGSSGALSSMSGRDGILSLPAILSRQSTANLRSASLRKKSKRGKASKGGVLKGAPRRALLAADSASLASNGSTDWTVSAGPMQCEISDYIQYL